MILLYNVAGEIEHHWHLPCISFAPANTLALKFNDAIDGARWVTDADDLRQLRRESASLSYTRAGLLVLGVEVQ